MDQSTQNEQVPTILIPDYPVTPTQSDVRTPSTQVPNNPPKRNIDKPKLDKPISVSFLPNPVFMIRLVTNRILSPPLPSGDHKEQ